MVNNSSLGMVRQWQALFYDGRYSNTHLRTGHGTDRIPDFVKLGDAYGCATFRCERDEDVDEVIKQALAINDRPVVIDFTVSPDAMVCLPAYRTTSSKSLKTRHPISVEKREKTNEPAHPIRFS